MTDFAANHYLTATRYHEEAVEDLTNGGELAVGEGGPMGDFVTTRLVLAGIHYQAAAVPDRVAARAAQLADDDEAESLHSAGTEVLDDDEGPP